MTDLDLPANTAGLRLCRMLGDRLRMYETLIVERGPAGVALLFRRAAISGDVGPIGETGEQWADLVDANGDWFDTVALSPGAFRALKNKWARCKVESTDGD